MSEYTNYLEFQEYISKNKRNNKIRLFFDIETLQYNNFKAANENTPTHYRNVTYSVAISYYDDDVLKVKIFPNFYRLFETIFKGFKNMKTGKMSGRAKIEMIAHNNNKYDNHFLLQDLLYYYPFTQRENLFLKSAENNHDTKTVKDYKDKNERHGIILEKRVKSANNLDMIFFYHGIEFTLLDNFMKTHASLKLLGLKLLKAGILEPKDLKTDFDYKAYNLDHDMSIEQAHDYAEKVFDLVMQQPEKVTYIKNDVVILANAVKYYDVIFPNFKYKKITFSSNVLDYYSVNALSVFQLLNKFKIDDDKRFRQVDYTDYTFSNENLYDYLKSFYRGGLNFYNYYKLGQVIPDVFSIDINSSYPYVMYDKKIPTFLSGGQVFTKEQKFYFDLTRDDEFYLFRMSKNEFNFLLMKVNNRIIQQIFVKYYTTNDYVNINSNTLRTLQLFLDDPLTDITIMSFIKFDCVDFGAKHIIDELYFVKTQGKLNNKIVMKTPMDYEITDEPNTDLYSKEEIDLSKTYLNGIYGIPALRPYYNLFRMTENRDVLFNTINGYKNSARNIVFSTFVTSYAFYNLLLPLSYLPKHEIENYFIYCDTDSLYLKREARHYIPSDFFDPIALGSWDIENEHITKMYVLNHKKYAYETIKKNRRQIVIKAGGIPQSAFHTKDNDFKKGITQVNDTILKTRLKFSSQKIHPYYTIKGKINQSLFNRECLPFETFIDTQFRDGIEITIENKTILNSTGTISFYPSTTLLDKGQGYLTFFSERAAQQIKDLKEQIKKDLLENPLDDDVLFIESSLGTFTDRDIFPKTHDTKNKRTLKQLIHYSHYIKEYFETGRIQF